MPELPKGVDDYDEEHVYPHCPAFKDIGDLRGPFDLGLIPIGAYVRFLPFLTPSFQRRVGPSFQALSAINKNAMCYIHS